jgi:hypothetical protein
MNSGLKKIYFSIMMMLLASGLLAQHVPSLERGDPKFRRKAQMEGNQVRTSIFNHGQTGREGGEFPINVQTPYEWPKNSGHVYLALTGIFVGGEVIDGLGQTQRIVDVCNYRSSPTGASWNFEPVPGYFNPNVESIANSVDKNTWPASWPDKLSDPVDPGWAGKWNGYFGKDIFNADQEIFYRASDDRYTKYENFFPDSTDQSRKGLGIILDVRVLAWSQVLVEDVVYILHTVKNDGTSDIKKVGVTIWIADFVGGNGDSQDDISEFDLLGDIAWSRDYDHRAPEFGTDPVGIVGVTFLETPGNASDRIDNDGDGEEMGPIVSEEMLAGEDVTNQVDDNDNGLIDENETHIAFQDQVGVGYADGIDANGNAEAGSPVVTEDMVNESQNDPWKRWPPFPASDTLIQKGIIHLLMVEADDQDLAFKDNIDNDDDGEDNNPLITQAMIDQAANDTIYHRYRVNGGKGIILYDLKDEDLGKKYADGIDNDGNGAIDEFMDEGIDEMIDEARNNGIDDDGDWDPFMDDVGLDGLLGTGDPGEGDGLPTSGAGTSFPGEPGIDVTDVSETDQMGITNAQYIPAGGLNISSDPVLWFDLMIPGKFYDPLLVVAGEYDLLITSSFFPLAAGQTEPISIAVILGNGPIPDANGAIRKQNVLKKRVRAQETYNNDYQFANAPYIPTMKAITGDNRITLFWDDVAENSFDTYINNIGGVGRDFEGYRIYRTSDPAFQDPLKITDAYGTLIFKIPIAQFDLEDEYYGLDSIGINGANFNLGDNTGLSHSWVDSTVQNGFIYYYAITSYDFGYPAGEILPTECPIRISLQGDGSVITGQNVVQVIPEAPAAGYIPPTLGNIKLMEGTTTGSILYDMVDINAVKDKHVYYVTFEETLRVATTPSEKDTLTTKNYTLWDSTAAETLVYKNTDVFDATAEQPLTDGFRLTFLNESAVSINKSKSGWSRETIPAFVFEKFVFRGGYSGTERPNDYQLIFGDVGMDTSMTVQIPNLNAPAMPVNFKVYNLSDQRFIDFGFLEVDTYYGGAGKLSARGARKDRIIFLEPNAQDSLVFTWWFYLGQEPDTTNGFSIPDPGDSAIVILRKPFLAADVFRFQASAGKIDTKLAKSDMDNIKVVPNPYVATARWEPANPYDSGRGPRSLHFTHLPTKCTIRIFTINGELVDTIEHESAFHDGTAYWDMLSQDNLSIAYGVYIYQVDAPGVGKKIGKFAVIK